MAGGLASPTRTTDGDGTLATPYRLAQIPSVAEDGDTFQFLFEEIGIGAVATKTTLADILFEIGAFGSVGPTDLTFETAPGEDEYAILSTGVAVPGGGNWALVPSATNSYRQLMLLTDLQALTSVAQDYYGDLGAISGEGDGPRRRFLTQVTLPDPDMDTINTDADQLAMDSEAPGSWAIAKINASLGYLVVRCFDDVDPRSELAAFISTTAQRGTPTGFHATGLSLWECANVQFRNLRIDRVIHDINAVGLAIQTSSPGTSGSNLGEATLENVEIRDCGAGALRLRTNATAAGQVVNITGGVYGGFNDITGQDTSLLAIHPFTSDPDYERIRLSSVKAYAHSLLGNGGAAAFPQVGSNQRNGLCLRGVTVGVGAQDVLIDQCTVQGVVGASDRVVGFDVRFGDLPGAGSEWNWAAYGARIDRMTCEDVPQLYFDHSCAVRRSTLKIGNATDSPVTATGPIDLGTNNVDALILHSKLPLDSRNANEAIGLSEKARLRLGGVALAHTAANASDPVFVRNGGTAGRNQLIGLHNAVVRSLSSGTKLANMGSSGSDTDLDVEATLFDGFTDDAAWYVSNGVSEDKAGFAALDGVNNALFDESAAFEADEVTPSDGSFVLTVNYPNSNLFRQPAFDDGTYFGGRLGPVQDGRLATQKGQRRLVPIPGKGVY